MGYMGDHLEEVIPDYVEYLDISPQGAINRTATRNQLVNKGVDGSEEIITLDGGKRSYVVEFPLDNLNETDHETIFDMFNDAEKADGINRTFLWINPKEDALDYYVYVVRFTDPSLLDILRKYQFNGFGAMRLKVIGIYVIE